MADVRGKGSLDDRTIFMPVYIGKTKEDKTYFLGQPSLLLDGEGKDDRGVLQNNPCLVNRKDKNGKYTNNDYLNAEQMAQFLEAAGDNVIYRSKTGVDANNNPIWEQIDTVEKDGRTVFVRDGVEHDYQANGPIASMMVVKADLGKARAGGLYPKAETAKPAKHVTISDELLNDHHQGKRIASAAIKAINAEKAETLREKGNEQQVEKNGPDPISF